ncbi:hypothetical protein RchiOBHm_Chr2g0128151 [Rosa chinensis]|uniref:Uncharacterized protein n=1 Tax=Rosa chinensis TaxID=74649 RepID=A0A2P6RU95_ROSCH|nr:hypothetical protein RchiOBHm_Chr2g0128151 [Rosa chinensis]
MLQYSMNFFVFCFCGTWLKLSETRGSNFPCFHYTLRKVDLTNIITCYQSSSCLST